MSSRIAAVFFIFAGLLIAALVLFESNQTSPQMPALFLNKEQKDLFAKCEESRKTMQQQGLPGKFSEVAFFVRDARLEEDPILKDLRKCFATSKKSPFRLEIELFSSDFGTMSSSDLQVQVSAFEIKSQNKVAEVGFRMDHEPYQDPSKAKATAEKRKKELQNESHQTQAAASNQIDQAGQAQETTSAQGSGQKKRPILRSAFQK